MKIHRSAAPTLADATNMQGGRLEGDGGWLGKRMQGENGVHGAAVVLLADDGTGHVLVAASNRLVGHRVSDLRPLPGRELVW